MNKLYIFLAVINCTIADQYKDTLFKLLNFYNKSIFKLSTETNLFGHLFRKENFIIVLLTFYAVFITFIGRRYEKISLSIFFGAFIFTLCGIFSKKLSELLPGFAKLLPKKLLETLPDDSTDNIFWISMVIAIFAVLIFFFLYKLVKILSMIAITYVFYDTISKYLNLSETTDIVSKIALVLLVIFAYIILSKAYSIVFSVAFALYGCLFLLLLVSFTIGNHSQIEEYILILSESKNIKEIIAKKEFIIWICSAGVGILFQMAMSK